ncbi:hypothetical protein [Paenibacillus sp. UMB4589-SE434]|uniref:hypothetical protein n=1 Tax=Paenibacillus sp. UMB4589-SE434 TaxID=3046314 RepID=UPI0025506F70|nr:hypothetical protein [Paenibacillus sp. UMB4589-SE434]MDK8181745.1 hypothetical protein [Paenibacillus sp. UMB4589-SE434]
MKKKWAIKDAHTSKVLFIEGSNIKAAVANENMFDILSFFVEDCDSLSVTTG